MKHLRAMTEAEIRKTAPPELVNLPRDFWKEATNLRPNLHPNLGTIWEQNPPKTG